MSAKGWEDSGELYTVKSRVKNHFTVTKFNEFFWPIKTYHVRRGRRRWMLCECPDKIKPMCKHRRLIQIFEKGGWVNKGWFFDWVDQSWEPPLTWPIHRTVDRVRLKRA